MPERYGVSRRHVRHPRRLTLNYWLGEAPRRITELALAGVRIDPLDRAGCAPPALRVLGEFAEAAEHLRRFATDR